MDSKVHLGKDTLAEPQLRRPKGVAGGFKRLAVLIPAEVPLPAQGSTSSLGCLAPKLLTA